MDECATIRMDGSEGGRFSKNTAHLHCVSWFPRKPLGTELFSMAPRYRDLGAGWAGASLPGPSMGPEWPAAASPASALLNPKLDSGGGDPHALRHPHFVTPWRSDALSFSWKGRKPRGGLVPWKWVSSKGLCPWVSSNHCVNFPVSGTSIDRSQSSRDGQG